MLRGITTIVCMSVVCVSQLDSLYLRISFFACFKYFLLVV